MSEYNKPVKITSPVGEAVWPKLNKPDTKFNKDGVYEVKLRVTSEESEPFVTRLQCILKDYVATLGKSEPKMAPLPWGEVTDDDGNPTGDLEFKFKLKAVGTSNGEQFTQRPKLYDSEGKDMTEEIGGGSRIQVGAEVVLYSVPAIGTGISLRLKAVKVFELKEYGGGAETWSFSDGGEFVTEGSSTATEEKPAPAKKEASDSDDYDF